MRCSWKKSKNTFIYNKFSKDYKNKYIRFNSWNAAREKFGLNALEAEKRYKNVRT